MFPKYERQYFNNFCGTRESPWERALQFLLSNAKDEIEIKNDEIEIKNDEIDTLQKEKVPSLKKARNN